MRVIDRLLAECVQWVYPQVHFARNSSLVRGKLLAASPYLCSPPLPPSGQVVKTNLETGLFAILVNESLKNGQTRTAATGRGPVTQARCTYHVLRILYLLRNSTPPTLLRARFQSSGSPQQEEFGGQSRKRQHGVDKRCLVKNSPKPCGCVL